MSIANQKKQRLADGIKLTEHVFGYKKMVMGELLYFGHDEPTAQSRALRVMSIVTDLKAKGQKRWTPSALALAKAIAKGQDDEADKPAKEPLRDQPVPVSPPQPAAAARIRPVMPVEVVEPVVMVHDAIDAYAVRCKADQSKARDHGYIGRVLAQKRAIPNMPLVEVGERELLGLVNFWRSKPIGTKCIWVGASKTWKVVESGKPIRAQTIKLNIGTARQMFRWIASSASGFIWNPPNLQPIFEMRNADVDRLRTPAEKMLAVRARNDEHAEHFTLDELGNLWSTASNLKRRLFFLLSLNAGCSTSELSALLIGHCFMDGKNAERPFVAFDRPKTGVYGKWFLWSESVQTLKNYLQPEFPYSWIDEEVEADLKHHVRKGRVYEPTGNTCPKSYIEHEMTLAEWQKYRAARRRSWELKNWKLDRETPVFSTDEGNSLLTTSPNGYRNDAVKLVWARWSATAGVNRLSWKHMRKTGSQLVRSAATDLGMNGDYMSELFLAHQAPIMSRPYNRRDDSEYEQLGRVLMELRKRLGKIFGDSDEHE
jgi:hypothetical protein